jgi:hypothetical protein
MDIIVGKGSVQSGIAFALWFPLVVSLFALVRPRRAVIFAYIFAWLFLPVAVYYVGGLPDITKTTVTTFAVLFGTMLFKPSVILKFRPRWFDIPIVVFCLAPFLSSMSNGLGVYDGLTGIFRDTWSWGLPYFLGRLYFNDVESIRDIAYGIFIGGIVYIPLVLYEVRMSPQLHNIVYGYFPHAFKQTVRFGGWRANVFMEHGLMVGMWMTAATVSGFWLRLSGAIRTVYNVPAEIFLVGLLGTCVLQKSTGALILLVAGLCVMAAVHYSRSLVPLTALAAACLIYVSVRALGVYDGASLVNAMASFLPDERVRSLNSRISGEEILGDHARQRIVFGWGGWGRNFVKDEKDRRLAITDSMWIIVFGVNGLVGLASFMGALLVPVFLVHRRIPPPMRAGPQGAACLAMATVLTLWVADLLANAMYNPIFIVIAGGLAGLQWQPARRRKQHVRFLKPARRPVVYSR